MVQPVVQHNSRCSWTESGLFNLNLIQLVTLTGSYSFGVMSIVWYNEPTVLGLICTWPLCVCSLLSPLTQAHRHRSQVGQGWAWTAGKVCAVLHKAEAPWLCLRDLFQDGRLAGSSAAACGNPALGRGLTHLCTWEAHLLCSSWRIYRVSSDNHINITWATLDCAK